MEREFITRNLLIKEGNVFRKTTIFLHKPELVSGGLYSANVLFSDYKKYSANIRGLDEFHAVQCAIGYVDAVCRNSIEPEFFSVEEESLLEESSES